MTTKVTMPQLGESVVEGTIGKWLVDEGQAVKKDQPLVEVLTDKADAEVPAPVSGVVIKRLVEVDQTIAVGDALCEIDESATATAGAPARAAGDNGAPSLEAAPSDEAEARLTHALTSPSVRKLARERGVDVGQVRGTGAAGRVTREDVLRATLPATEHIEVTPPRAARTPAAGPQEVPSGGGGSASSGAGHGGPSPGVGPDAPDGPLRRVPASALPGQAWRRGRPLHPATPHHRRPHALLEARGPGRGHARRV